MRDIFTGKKVFVTGHTGFKGSWLCEWLLLLGAEVSGFSLPDPVTRPSLFEQLGLSERITDLRGDIRTGEAISDAITQAQPDFVFHLAAQPLVRFSYEQPKYTWETNVMGTIHVLEALRKLKKGCAAVMVTTDKVYHNRECDYSYRECDQLGGHDPYSSSKAGCEIAIHSWRQSFFQDHPVALASARAGNVIGGGDWADNRIVPDCIRALDKGEAIPVRNLESTRPWQHVLEPLSGYLLLATKLTRSDRDYEQAYNFGPRLESNRSVKDLVVEIIKNWKGEWQDCSDPNAVHEAGKLNLVCDLAYHQLGWTPRWDFETTVEKTVQWYRQLNEGECIANLTRKQILEYVD